MSAPPFPAPQAPGPAPGAPIETFGTYEYVAHLVLTTLLGLALAIVYRTTHKGLSYSQSFTQTIVFVAVIVAVVMMTVQDNPATAFALVDALSIIRFRTVVKDTRDTAFVFASLAVGMAAGRGLFVLAGVATAVVAALALALFATNFGALAKSEFILRFTFDQGRDGTGYLTRIREFARRSNVLHGEPTGDGRRLRLTYDVTLEKDATAEKLTGALAGCAGVADLVLIVSKNDIDY
jgi:hypothetical protein